MDDFSKSQDLIHSIIGEGTHFKGDLYLNGLLKIDGDFEGNIRSEGRILIGRGGRAHCVIDAAIVVIGGILRGEIRAASKVVLLSTSIVIGTIRSPRIIVEDGVIFHGHCTVSENTDVLSSVLPAQDEKFSIDWSSRSSQTKVFSSSL